ncbi:MAG TPA: hypothetical protein VFF84_02825 [Sphingobium sp.]|nr:hypothetical protein [Sphingobium sp.]
MSSIPKSTSKVFLALSAAMVLAGTAGAQPGWAAGESHAATGSDFATYDADKSGSLDAAEFSSWYQAKHQAKKGDKAVSADDMSKHAAQAFSQADADHDQRVSKMEMAAVHGR